ncbi:hypothetical protein, partial [Vibrio parahaemolyticus]|uniref:hypothetical protein n=1 Tax=Vibrio parahaemolyticus TaxID=670 RepID=UPI0023600E12
DGFTTLGGFSSSQVKCLRYNGLGLVVGVVHHLTRRYVYLKFKGLKFLGSIPLSLWQFVPSRLSKSALSI